MNTFSLRIDEPEDKPSKDKEYTITVRVNPDDSEHELVHEVFEALCGDKASRAREDANLKPYKRAEVARYIVKQWARCEQCQERNR